MAEALNRYRELHRQLIWVRWLNQGADSPEEEVLLERMDKVWWELSEEEKALLDKKPCTSLLPEDRIPAGHRAYVDQDPATNRGGPPKSLQEVA